MKIKIDINYIVTKESDNGKIKVGDYLIVKKNRYSYSDTVYYNILTSPKETDPKFFGMKFCNSVTVCDTEEELQAALKGVKVELDKKWAKQYVADLQKKIDDVTKKYKLNSWSGINIGGI